MTHNKILEADKVLKTGFNRRNSWRVYISMLKIEKNPNLVYLELFYDIINMALDTAQS